METIVSSGEVDVKIDINMPFVVIGEKNNPTGRKKLAAKLSLNKYSH